MDGLLKRSAEIKKRIEELQADDSFVSSQLAEARAYLNSKD